MTESCAETIQAMESDHIVSTRMQEKDIWMKQGNESIADMKQRRTYKECRIAKIIECRYKNEAQDNDVEQGYHHLFLRDESKYICNWRRSIRCGSKDTLP
eukprot:187722_1